ncbi:hypothetical protein D027_4736A, partial [Vibrio parahaemolyticus 861]
MAGLYSIRDGEG